MLIICCSVPRSGGTLLYQLTKEIAELGDICKGRGFAKESITSGVVKTEFCEPWMIDRVKNGALAFGSYRDFRDIIVSLQGFYNRRERIKGIKKRWTIDDVLSHRPVILESYYGWEEYATWFRYEQGNFAYCVTSAVSDCLNVQLSTIQKQAIIFKYNLDNNTRRVKQQKIPMDAGAGSMLTKWHISPTKGQSTWREALSQSDIDKIEYVGNEWLREHGYN